MKKTRAFMSAVLASSMILSLTACSDEAPSGNLPDPGNAPSASNVTSAASTAGTTFATDADVQEAVGGLADKVANPDLNITRRLKWMGWWELDETKPEAELFKEVYGVPETGDSPDRDGKIFDYINVAYADRYDKLAAAIQSGDSPDLFPFEIRDFPYGVLKGRYQPVDEIIDLSSDKWNKARDVMEQFKLNGRYYCAVYEISFDSLLYYRKSVIDGLGADDPRELFEENNWTWDTFLSLARAFQNSGDGKFAIDGYHPENEFLTSTGTPLVGNDGTQIINNMYSPNVERAENLLATLQKENLRYPRHELNNWSTNPKAWASGDTLFWADGGTWVYENTISPFVEKFGWADDEVKVVPFPRDPQADKYYHFMKQDSLMWCKGSDYADGVAAWIDCCATTAADPDTPEAATKQYMEKYNWSKENLDFINSLTKLDGTSPITPIFDFKNGLGSDISSNDTSESNVEQLTKYVYLQGDQTYTQLRETNFAPIQARIDDINKEISENS